MSELRSVIESFRAESLAEVPDALVEETFEELHRAVQQLEAERLRWLAELDRRRAFERDGHLSCAAWLASRHKVGWGEARRSVRVARELEHMPATRAALEDGSISLSAARALVEARAAAPETFEAAEPVLVDAAQTHTVSDLGRVLAYWRQRAEAASGVDEDERLRERRGLHASATVGGMVRVDGDLDPVTGETFLTALGAVLDRDARTRIEEDSRTPAQRRADALGELCRQWLDRSDRPMVGGERPHVSVTVDLESLRGIEPKRTGEVAESGRGLAQGDGGGAELDHAGPVGTELARLLACDASVTRVVLGPRSEPLDVGRRTPVLAPALRRAVIVRDRTCRFPGCERPQSWCDAHHVVHWAKGGSTALSNLVLLCRRHHRLIHAGRFGLELVGGGPVFTRADGSILDADRAPP